MVLVIRLISHHEGSDFDNLERFMRIGMRSYTKFLDKQGLADFIVISPKKDLTLIREKLTGAYPEWPWKFVQEDALVSVNCPSGWAKQQTAKFAVARLVTTPTYLIVDDDTYLTKPFGVKDVYWKGKVILNKAELDFPMWYLWSSQIAQVDYDQVQCQPFHMAITPEIFVTSAVKKLVQWLEETYGSGMKWQEVLANHKFTEYTLYTMFLRKHNLFNMLYAIEEDAPALYGHVTSGPEHDLATQVKLSFEQNDRHFFSFVQSSLPIDVATVEKTVGPYLA